MAYALKVINNKLTAGYYGAAFIADNDGPDYFRANDEVPVRGRWANKTPVLEAVFNDGTRDLDLIYSTSSVSKKNGYGVLRIEQRDSYYPLKVVSYYKVLPEYNIIEKWIELTNAGKKEKSVDTEFGKAGCI